MANEAKRVAVEATPLGAACYRCRGFRHACDRTKPTCSRCKRRGITCTYPEAAPTLKKLQKATETLSDRIKKFGELLKTGETDALVNNKTRESKDISLQQLAQPRSTVGSLHADTHSLLSLEEPRCSVNSSSTPSIDVQSDMLIKEDDTSTITSISSTTRTHNTDVASTSSFSIYPCAKCFKDLQQCDLTLPSCSRCAGHQFECVYTKTEPKANHVSQVLNTMNKVMDQWQESIDKMAKDFAQKTRDFGQRVDQSFKKKPLQPFAWKITSTNKGLSVESNVSSYNDLSKLVDQFKRTMHISVPLRDREPIVSDELHFSNKGIGAHGIDVQEKTRIMAASVELDDTSSIHTSSSFSFGARNHWPHTSQKMEDNFPVDLSQELTDNLVQLYCKTPCCSANRLPVLDTADFLARYNQQDATKRPSEVLVSAVCSLAARNAFQLHVWGKRPAEQMPERNMGRAISMAYCQRGRELLADCFDEPSMDNCQAAFLLSYSNLQNGHYKVVAMYEWIAFTMAQELGLYDEGRVLIREESMLVWCLYYFRSWYRVLQGELNSSNESDQFRPKSAPLPPPPKPDQMDWIETGFGDEQPEADSARDAFMQHYIYTQWYYLFQLQVIHQDVLYRLLSIQEKQDTNLVRDLLVMQDRLEEFYESMLPEWKSPDLESLALDQMAASTSSPFFILPQASHDHSLVDIHEFARSCILSVHVAYSMNKILLYQAFFPSAHLPTSPFSIECMNICIDAAYGITQTLGIIVRQRDECSIFLLGFLFANMIYIKLLNYNEPQFQEFATQCLEQSIHICKASKAYLYDFESTRSYAGIMEKDVYNACGVRAFNLPDASNDSYSFPFVPPILSYSSVPFQ
ncbi:hypothetical protein BD560DRAFT_381118 [Blakeslea trispora]|nr:hypothetical protein BD560DRAFT_381118 [Blakeslea trispora]